ncbi:MAG: efflux RND transporter periplasmic adaptor subunit [Hamadaea sp.]|nr:efflux RND transporter periplasmic adaptor subunit [Hamadaea sp.]
MHARPRRRHAGPRSERRLRRSARRCGRGQDRPDRPGVPEGDGSLSGQALRRLPEPRDGLVSRRRRRGRTVATAGGAVLAAGAAVAAAVGFGGGDPAVPVSSTLPPATAQVTKATLTQTKNVAGTLGYGDAVTVSARQATAAAPGGGAGTVTWLAPKGSTVGRGQPMYKVDDQPVVLLYGPTPFYRLLSTGVEGADVKTLESNLKALGYSGFTVDEEFTSATADAVEDWQEDLGVPETGRVDVDDVVVAPAQARIADHKAEPGAAANGPLLAYTGTTRVITVGLDVADQQLVKKGLEATVTLPGGATVRGTVASVGTVATKSTSGSGAGQTTTTTIDVVVTVADQKALGGLDEAPVDVTLVASRKEGVLAVPVGALVALAEGGYGVLVVEGSATRYVAVETGMFAGGRVEITAGQLTEGMTVGVPK